MIQIMQAADFFRNLSAEDKNELCKAIAEDIYFLDEQLQREILALLHETEPEICDKIQEINRFTLG